MINKQRIQLWVDALRSGEFKQGTGGLRDIKNNYCCLGVACEVYCKETGKGGWLHKGSNGYMFRDANKKINYESSFFLNQAILNWFGLPKHDRDDVVVTSNFDKYNDKDIVPRRLSGLNDAGSTFEVIANLIEESFLKE